MLDSSFNKTHAWSLVLFFSPLIVLLRTENLSDLLSAAYSGKPKEFIIHTKRKSDGESARTVRKYAINTARETIESIGESTKGGQ